MKIVLLPGLLGRPAYWTIGLTGKDFPPCRNIRAAYEFYNQILQKMRARGLAGEGVKPYTGVSTDVLHQLITTLVKSCMDVILPNTV
jgi:hypothetical protein